ncbi:MAG: beta-lactamase family protein [Prolixibacteraceae bacterium]|nr:beta-lactamase family protein [Prolixibacteraceae bacterium]
MKKNQFKYLFLVLFILICVTPGYEKTGYNEKDIPAHMLAPLNKRLANEKSQFEYSSYIDRQILRFIERSELKGVSIAFVQNEKLVYAKSFGYANIEEGGECKPEHLFRIASVSKLITAVGILKLVEEGKMNLDDTVFGEDGYFNDPEYLNLKDPKIKEITVLHLLNHTAGWTQRYGDPMFNPLVIASKVGDEPPATFHTYMKFVISRRLYYHPGTAYSYSNLGYFFLGAIIEKITGMKYEDYIRFKILYPNGIFDMHIAGNMYNDRKINEVKYYEQEGAIKVKPFSGSSTLVPKPYGGNDVKLLGAAGGWIASAPELAHFMTLIDGFDEVPDILSEESIRYMTGGFGNPLGWRDAHGGYWSRTGSFAGSAAMLYRNPNGIEWVFLSNSSSWKGPDFSEDIKSIMNRIAKRVKHWPNLDLFNFFNTEILSYDPANILSENIK